MLGRAALAALFGLSLVSTASAGVSAYVANAFESSVSVVDVRTGASQATVPVGCDPRDVVAHPDGSRVYVANTCGGDLDAQPGSVSVIDTATNAVVATVIVPYGPVALAVDASRRRLYAACLVEVPFTDEDSSGALFIADLDTGAPIDMLPLFLVPRDLVLTQDGTHAFVSGTAGFRDDEDVVHRTFEGVVATAVTGLADGPTYRGGGGPLDVDPTGTRFYVVDHRTDELAIVDTASATELARLPVGVAAQDVLLDRRRRRVFVTSAGESPNAPPDAVTVIDTRSYTIAASFDGGWAPGGLARIARGNALLVTNFYAGELLVLNARTGALRRTISVGAGADTVATIKVRRGRAQRRP